MPDSNPFEPYPPLHQELERFHPAPPGWYALYSTKSGARRQRVAGWGTYYDGGELVIVPLVPDLYDGDRSLIAAGRRPSYMGMQHTGDSVCDCTPEQRVDDILDPDWCEACQADIRRP